MNDSAPGRREFLAAVATGSASLSGCSESDAADDGSPDGRSIAAIDERTDAPAVWNVADFGIVGDGSTEVGQSIHELLAKVDHVGGGTVYFPPGRYLLERTPLIGDDTLLEGAGRSTVFEGVRADGDEGKALFSNTGYDEPGYGGASNWGISDVRIDSPRSNGIMPAHADAVRLENIYGDRIYHHHVDVVSSTSVVVDGFRATRGGAGESDAPVQFDAQPSVTEWNAVLDGDASRLVADDGTPTTRCTLSNFEIDPENDPAYGVHLHRGRFESLRIADGYVTGCHYTAIRADPDESFADLTIEGVSCINNARGITLGHVAEGRRELTIDDVTIRTDDKRIAAGSGLYAAGVDGGAVSNVRVDGPFTNAIIFDDMTDLKMNTVAARGADDQAFRFRENVDVTLTNASAADCGGAGIYSGPGSTVAYGGVTFDDVGTEVVADGALREWTTSGSP